MIQNKGKYTDCNPINQPPGTWRGGKNFVVNKKKAAFVTEPGTDLTATDFPFTESIPIGSAVFPDGSYVQFGTAIDKVNGVGKDRIGLVSKEGIYTDYIVDNALNFSSSFPIRSYKVDHNAYDEKIVGFTDKYNSFRVLNVTKLPFDLNPDKSLVHPEDIVDIEGFPKFKLPLYTFTVNQVGGSVFSGAYSACFAYESKDGTRTPNSPPYKVIYITDDPTNVGYDKFDGCPPRTRTSKSITFNITNVDTRYDRLVLIIVRKMGGATEVAEIKKVDITATTASITYVGTETESTLGLEGVLTPRPLYSRVGCVAQLNSQLYLGNLDADEDIEYQAYANNIRVHYNSKLIPVSNINDSHKNVLPGAFGHAEVYALYIAFVLKNGSWSRAFHIPGRAAIPGGTSTITTNINRNVDIVPPSNPGTWDPASFSEAVVNNTSGYYNSSIYITGTTNYNGTQIVVEHHDSRVVFQHTFNGYQSGSTTEPVTTTVTTTGDTGNSGLASGAGLDTSTKVYQIEDTTNKPQPSYITEAGVIRSSNLNGPTNMGYWENQNEVYPIGFPDLAGQNVKHHVFPSIRKCKELHYPSVAGYGRDQFDILGIDVANVQIPSSIADKIEGWGIFYARRNYSSSLTLGNDLYLPAHRGEFPHNAQMLWSAGGNWATQSFSGTNTSGSAFTNFDIDANSAKYLRGHNFELLKDMPALASSSVYLEFEFKCRKLGLASSYENVTHFVGIGKAGAWISQSGDGQGQNPGMLIDLTDTSANCTVTKPATRMIRSISEVKYLPANIVDGNIRTIKTEDIIHMKVHLGENILTTIEKGLMHLNTVGRTANYMATDIGAGYGGEETYLMTYKQVKTNVYDGFDNQLLTLTDTLSLPNETSKKGIMGGDAFVSIRSFICSAPRWVEDLDSNAGVTIIRAHIYEGRYNVGLRHETVGEPTTKHYPKTPPTEFWRSLYSDQAEMIFERSGNPNGIAYNIDYNTTNTYIQLGTYNVNQRSINHFPFRVIRGGVTSGTATSINGWKTFLAADYYESNRNRGEITDLFVLDDNLFIQHMFGLFRTLGTEKLSLGSTEVYLGTSDIFAQKPKELISTELGFLGSQNIFAGVSFEGGRFWADQSRGKIFLLSRNGVNEISKDGMYEFFRDNLKINNSYPDSPIVGEGLIATYDPKYERIILVKKSIVNPFTLSYTVEREQNYWAFDHGYTPDYLFCTSNDFYGYKNNRIHKFNSPTRVARYFESGPQRSEVEIVFNEENHRNKEFFNVNWISEVFAQSGTLLKDKTLTAIRVRTSYQDSGEIALVPFTTFSARYTTRRFKNTWNFNKMKDSNGDVFKRKSMVDNYCIVTYIFSNEPNLDATQNSLYLYLLNAKAILAEM